MCATLAAQPALISPIKFHNSVHNAAAGYWTIGTGCLAASTAVTAFEHSFAAGLLEALTQCVADARPVLLVAFDVQSVGPLATVTTSAGLLAAALVLAPGAQRAQPSPPSPRAGAGARPAPGRRCVQRRRGRSPATRWPTRCRSSRRSRVGDARAARAAARRALALGWRRYPWPDAAAAVQA